MDDHTNAKESIKTPFQTHSQAGAPLPQFLFLKAVKSKVGNPVGLQNRGSGEERQNRNITLQQQ
ncbi:uncharacterized protein G2W53_011909 [Senna tora]|uniref:Uncharacterized protein n=1 Tax=Senna tora TaxID=362788 RepID=A0A834TZX7_9FABA|nr:uncharacterized protein G2W53_011909 [Senna tora]